MNWVAYGLLAVNLVYLTFNLHARSAAQPPVEAAPLPRVDSVNRMPLLSELGEHTLRRRGPSVLAAPARPPEPDVSVASAPASAATRQPQAAPSPPSERRCYTIGPLDRGVPVDPIMAWFQRRGAEVEVRTDERREVAVYWAYFPPFPSRAAAAERVAQMRAEGIDDIIAVHKGDMANAISLGVFSRRDTLERRLRQIRAKGYEPSTAPRYRTTLATWVDVTADEGSVDRDAFQRAFPDRDMNAHSCSIARRPSLAPAPGDTVQPPIALPE